MYAELKGLDGRWTLFTEYNSPLPPGYVLAPFTAVNQNQIWINVWISQGLGVPAKQYGLVLTNGVEWYEYKFGEHGLPIRATECMATDEHNLLWLSVPYVGICSFNGKHTILHRFGHAGLPEQAFIRGLHVAKSNRVFAATLAGMYRFTQDRWEKIVTSCRDLMNCATIFGVDQRGSLWFTCQTPKETHFFTNRAGSWESVCSLPMGHKKDEVVCFTVDKDDRVWLGRRSGGLMIWERGKWSRLTTRDCPLLYGEIQDVAIDEFHNVWVGTAGGYAVFDGHDWHDWGVIHLGSQDRPVSREVLLSADSITVSQYVYIGGHVAIDSIGRKWLGSSKGLVMFAPHDPQQ